MNHYHLNIIILFPCRPFSMPREVSFTVTDDLGGVSSPAVARVTFNAIDDTPILDLNGLQQFSINTSIQYTEGDNAVKVSQS